MKKKLILFTMILFLLTGCTVEYNLVIHDDNTVQESATILQKNYVFGNTIDEVKEQLNWELVFTGDEITPGYFYNRETVIGASDSGLKYDYSFNTINFETESEFLKTCYETYNIKIDEEIIYIYARGFKCSSQLNNDYNLKINITANGQVVEGNYNKKSGNTYTWNLNNLNSDYINLKLNKKSLDNNFTILSTLLLIFVPVLIAIIVLITIYIKNKQNNKI